MNELKLCKNCQHFLGGFYPYQSASCFHPSNTTIELVRGNTVHRHSPKDMRDEDIGSCGPEGKFFLSKPYGVPTK